MRRRALASSVLSLLACSTPGRAADAPDVEAGLGWLASKQAADGSFGYENKLALTGMAGLALLASGSTPRHGTFRRELERAVLFVLSCQPPEGRAFQHPSSGYSAIHNHGFALLFLTQCYGESGTSLDARLRSAIQRGVRASVESQRENGGFSYFLFNRQPLEWRDMWRDDEASTTISQIQALRGARDVGLVVDRRAIDRAGAYIARSQHASGGFYYSIGSTPRRVSMEEGSDEPTFAITAAALAVLHSLGTYEGPALERGLAYVERSMPPTKARVPFFYYAHYYAAQVMHLVGGARGKRWTDAVRAELAARQRPDGRWPDDDRDSLKTADSEILNTAWALQVCLIDRSTLPIHER